ncbi:MAG TPA: Mut7-C RNAse domain-containing protein [Kiritimatiellia bacterium]|nr:Mut7-C RNAse domain-containing protein [Kiritimatiellia bacterium]HSA18342.1 Mut7-C RNAse domain-containing protein [Kiritimatiellia bacterium]
MRPSFMLDHMVIKLGKYLRILGYDAVWDAANRTHDLIMAANRDGRWFLTRNTRLSNEYPRAEHLVTLASDDPVEQLGELHAALPLDFTSRLFTRCIRCNIELEFIPHKEDARRFVHPNVWQKHDSFFRCPGCGTVFWKGSHVRNTCRKLGLDAGPV